MFMKKICLYVLLSVLFFSCKTDPEAAERMDLAETLLTSDPDSAYAILAKIDLPDKLNERQFARWCMLYCQAADKTYHDMAYTEQLDRALAWYKRHGSAEQQAWIWLYLGRSYVEDKLFVPATKAYSDALELAKKKHLYNVAGYICSYTADLYTYTRQRSEERRKFEEAAEFFKLAENERSYAFALRDVSRTWVFDDSLSLALDLMLKADSIVTTMNDSVGMASIANGMGNIYKHLDQIGNAKTYLSRSLAYDTTDNAPTYLSLSTLFYNNDQLDSARYYAKMADCPTSNLYTPSDRLYLSYLIEKEAGNIPDAFQYLEQCYEAKDSLYDQQKQVDIIDAEKRHNSLTIVRQNRKLYSIIYLLSGFIIIASLIGVLFYLYKDRKRLERIYRQQLLLDEKEQLLSKLENKVRQKEISEAKTNKEENRKICEKLSQIKKEVFLLRYEKLQQSTFFQELKERLNNKQKYGQTLSEQDWEELKEQIDSVCPNWQVAIQDNEPLKKAEIETCYFSFLNISIKSEAMLLGINPDSANKRRLRTRQALKLTNSKMSICEYIIQKTSENTTV